MQLSKIYENAKNNTAFDRCVAVMSRLMMKYGNQVLEQREEKAPLSLSDKNSNPPAELVVLHMRAKPYDTSHASRRWYGLTLAKGLQPQESC